MVTPLPKTEMTVVGKAIFVAFESKVDLFGCFCRICFHFIRTMKTKNDVFYHNVYNNIVYKRLTYVRASNGRNTKHDVRLPLFYQKVGFRSLDFRHKVCRDVPRMLYYFWVPG